MIIKKRDACNASIKNMQDKRESLYRIQLQFKTEQNRENNMYFSLINIAIVFMSTSSLSVHVSIIFCSLFEQKLLWFFFVRVMNHGNVHNFYISPFCYRSTLPWPCIPCSMLQLFDRIIT